jgi:uncharacterized OsmC-like protein
MTMRYTVEAETVGGTASATSKGTAIPFDGTREQSPSLPGPADLLATAFAACVLKNVERFSHMLPFRYERAAIVVVAEREEPPPRIARIRYTLKVVTDEPTERVELLHRNIQKFGTIYNTLAAACDVSGEIEAVKATAGDG